MGSEVPVLGCFQPQKGGRGGHGAVTLDQAGVCWSLPDDSAGKEQPPPPG